jgi:hypothetical protein
MSVRAVVLVSIVLFAKAANLPAQVTSAFGTCAYWQEHKPDLDGATAIVDKSYRIGFAHGFVFGILGDFPREASSDGGWPVLESRFSEGLIEALQRPAFLVDAFDQKCGDYRNRRVRLSDIGLLVLLEVGGMSTRRIDRALEVMRAGGDDYRARALEVLASPESR